MSDHYDDEDIEKLKKQQDQGDDFNKYDPIYAVHNRNRKIDKFYYLFVEIILRLVFSVIVIICSLFFYHYAFSAYLIEQKINSRLVGDYFFMNLSGTNDHQIMKMKLDFDPLYEGFNDIPITLEDNFKLQLDFEGLNNYYVFHRNGAILVGKYNGFCINWKRYKHPDSIGSGALNNYVLGLENALKKDCQLIIENVKIGEEFLIHTNQSFDFEVTGHHNYGLIMNVETVEVNSSAKFFLALMTLAVVVTIIFMPFDNKKNQY